MKQYEKTMTQTPQKLPSRIKTINEFSEISLAYRPFLEDWMLMGIPCEQIIEILILEENLEQSAQYLVAWFQKKVMFIIKRGEKIRHIILSHKDLISMDYDTDLFGVQLAIRYQKGDALGGVSLQYDKMGEGFIEPMLCGLLGEYEKYPVEQKNQKDRGLLDIAPNVEIGLCYRMGDEIYHCYKSAKGHKQYFIASMEKGLVLLDSGENVTGAVYIVWEAVENVTYETQPEYNFISINTNYGKNYEIPESDIYFTSASEFAETLTGYILTNGAL